VRTLGRLIRSRLADVLRLAKPAEIGRFSSFLITSFACFFAGAVGVVRIDSLAEVTTGEDRVTRLAPQ
jgi:hypothetical protein